MAKNPGLTRLQKRLDAIPRAVKQAVQPALKTSGDELAHRMRALAPEDTGALKRSIAVTPPGGTTPPYSQPGGSQTATENQVLVTVGNSEVRYPHLVEYGTANAEAQPYFWPAYRLTRKRITNRIKRAMRKAVKEAR
ncbi:phage protein, HK97 gp10 family [Nitratireductor aquibiodomus]|uniref:Phage protein, HK97 gp10 family n=1 Tax=Nitratireductor aquibiodomus TaxID=204799 RepID=A0A1H4JAW7_9HYPH|nr:HK97-gp10 family putative phage morphogenesis protein [Nitratireductor aquibiodomus]SEB43403.1 phage protein, HK97 gp10 family [Nitratireductor aquibiodomus]